MNRKSRIKKIGAAILKDNKVLVVKEHGWKKFGFPGGTIKPDEKDAECLKREIREELDTEVKRGSLEYLGRFQDTAMNEPGTIIEIKLFKVETEGSLKKTPDVEEMFWFGKNDDMSKLGPIDRNHLIPELIKRGLIR